MTQHDIELIEKIVNYCNDSIRMYISTEDSVTNDCIERGFFSVDEITDYIGD